MSAIVAEGLGKRYGRRWALRDCTLEIPDGSVVGLVGANGAGKSTLLHLTVGLLEPTEGSLAVLGGRPGADAAQLAQGRVRRPGRARVRRGCRSPITCASVRT